MFFFYITFKLKAALTICWTVMLTSILFSCSLGRLDLDSRLQEQENSQVEKAKEYGKLLWWLDSDPEFKKFMYNFLDWL